MVMLLRCAGVAGANYHASKSPSAAANRGAYSRTFCARFLDSNIAFGGATAEYE